MTNNVHELLSRKKAIQNGLTHYFTGKQCHKGHIAHRFVKTGHCVECSLERNRSREKIEYRKKYKARNYETILRKNRELYQKNAEQYRQYNREYQVKNASIQRPKNAARAMLRIAAKLQRTPSWLTNDDLWMIKETYDLARKRSVATQIKWEVDHIIPLRGAAVSGLHVPWNLQVIPRRLNRTKGNKLINQAIA